MRTLLSTLATLTLSLPLSAQCPISGATFQSYGSGCTSVTVNGATLTGTFDKSNCTLSFTTSAFGGCCNTYLRDFVWVVGGQKASVPMPYFGKGCTLLVQPLLVVVTPGTTATLNAKVPTGTNTGTFLMQSAAHYFTTIGFRNDYELTAGLSITLK